MADDFTFTSGDLSSPANSAVVVTPSDGADLGFVTRALFVGGAGNITLRMRGSVTSVVFTGVLAGQILPIRASRILATGTTATNIVALW